MKKALEEWLDPSTDGEVATDLPWENNNQAKVATATSTATAVKPASTTKSTDDISAAFDDLFNQ